jgi:hypothetical protein
MWLFLKVGKGRVCLTLPISFPYSVDPRFSAFGGVKIGPCPDNESFCRTLTCPGGCGEKGFCDDGTCYCLPGWVGPTCDLPICTPSSCSPDSACNPATGVCERTSGDANSTTNGGSDTQISAQNDWDTWDEPITPSTQVDFGVAEWRQRLSARHVLEDGQVVADVEGLTSWGGDLLLPPSVNSTTLDGVVNESAMNVLHVLTAAAAPVESGGGGGVDSTAAFWTACLSSCALLLAALW